ncbi:UNVERIFIED_CONTAM: hypothetical protein GTU68_017554, partial [Idotea baltica]|nr:hypothetical protein [Idotea baltica]
KILKPIKLTFIHFILQLIVFLVPTAALLLHFIIKRNKTELCQGLLALSLALVLNGVITNTIKVLVGMSSNIFINNTCFYISVVESGLAVKGDEAAINEGRKSFPSGHASFSFCSLGFLTLWLCGKLRVFSGQRSEGWKLVVAGSPLIFALMIAVSRTCDYHHHWQGNDQRLSEWQKVQNTLRK